MTITGKHNFAEIMIEEIDETTEKQIINIVNLPQFSDSKIVIMPDCHKGAGCVIGFTQTRNKYLIPNIIGVDISCGVVSYKIGRSEINFSELDNFIRNEIPNGFNVNEKNERYADHAIEDLKKEIRLISDEIESDGQRNVLALGSLGGGNHFIEIGVDENNENWLTIHSGSRKFGLDIANYHQNKAKKYLKAKLGSAEDFKETEYLEEEKDINRYVEHMKAAQKFASYNRQIIAEKIISFLMAMYICKIESVHNYICFEDNIIRKGAIRSYKDEQVVIPFNMEDGSIIGVGKSNPKWNYSAPHGAGRILSRTQAKKNLNLVDAQKSMQEKGIFTTSLNQGTLDEVKGAYKDKELIVKCIADTVDIQHFVKPIYNFKAAD